MLTTEAIKKINESLEKGYDVEVQRQKNGIKILKYRSEVCYKSPKENSEKKADQIPKQEI